jgi:hypothetical protein
MDLDLNQFKEKKVTLVVNPAEGGDAEELEGTVVAVTGSAIMFRPKGKTSPRIIEKGSIESIEHAATGDKKLAVRTLKVVQFGQARAHLLERHGSTLKAVNAMTEKEAFDLHAGLDHVALDLGHVHKDKADKPEAEAPEAEDED